MIGAARVLCVCTHNRTRSVMAGALLDDHLRRLGVDAMVETAGTHEAGHAAMDRAVRLLADRGIDARSHRSRRIDAGVMGSFDLVLTAERDHVVWIAGQWPDAFRRTFTLPEAVRRAALAPPGNVTIDEWVTAVGAARPVALDYLDDESVGELPDPTGRAPSAWDASFLQIDDLTRRLAESLAGQDAGAVKVAVRRLSRAVDRVVRPPQGVTVLIYHRVGGGSSSVVDLDAAMFDDHLAYLVEHHRLLSLADALQELTTQTDEPDPGVVVTFDDGTADFVDVSVPALARHGVPATLYLATRFVDEGVDFPWGAPAASWAGLRDCLASGVVSVGSHTHSHRLLDRLDPGSIDDELDRSIDLIGEHLGVRARDFAYPKAVAPSPVAEVAVRRRFRSASLATSRVNQPGRTDPHRLWRTPVQTSDSPEWFAAKASGGLRLEGELRQLSARLRYRGADA